MIIIFIFWRMRTKKIQIIFKNENDKLLILYTSFITKTIEIIVPSSCAQIQNKPFLAHDHFYRL